MKFLRNKKLTFLIGLTVFASLFVTSITFSSPNRTSQPQTVLTGKDSGVRLEKVSAAVSSVQSDSTAIVLNESPDFPERYIILLKDAPLAVYKGGLDGLSGTSLQSTGSQKLDVTNSTSKSYITYLETQHALMVEKIEQTLGHKIEVKDHFKFATNGISVIITPDEAVQVLKIPGIRMVSRVALETIQTDAGPDWIQAKDIWDGSSTGGLTGSKGEGVIVGILDTGINSNHPSFAAKGEDGYQVINPWSSGVFAGVCDPANPVYDPSFVCNDKLIGGWDFIFNLTPPGMLEYPTPEDENGHGSHTSSTAVGNIVSGTLIAPTITLTHTISGVAPHSNLIMYDVCYTNPDNGIGYCPMDASLAAIEQAIVDGVDIINFPISGGNDPYNDPVELAFLSAFESGIFVSTINGNGGPGYGTAQHLSPWVSSAAVTTHDRLFQNALIGMTGGSTPPPADIIGKSLTTSYGPARIVYAAEYGDPTCPTGAFPPNTWHGEIVICDSGTFPSGLQVESVKDAGAGGFVLAGTSDQAIFLPNDGFLLPGVNITNQDANLLKQWLSTDPDDHSAAIQGTYRSLDTAFADILPNFSSRGPNPVLEVLKPNLTAPGMDIWAAVNSINPVNSNLPEYGLQQGSSLSSSHIAGAAALMHALHPDWTPAEILSALQTGAVQTVKNDGAVTQAEPFAMGSGRVSLEKSGLIGLVLNERGDNFALANPAVGGDATSLNLPSFYNSQCVIQCSWTRTVRSVLPVAATYSATVSPPVGISLTISPTLFTILPGGMQQIEIHAEVYTSTQDIFNFGNVVLQTAASFPGTGIPILETGFEGSFPPSGWSRLEIDGNNNFQWAQNNYQHFSGMSSAYHSFGLASEGEDGMLITPVVSLGDHPVLKFWERTFFPADYKPGAHSIWICTSECDNPPINYSQILETGALPDTNWRQTVVNLDDYANQNVRLAFRYKAFYADGWYLDDFSLLDIPPAQPVSQQHFPVVIKPTSGQVPKYIDINTRRNTGSQVSSGYQAIPITELTVQKYGLIKATMVNQLIRQDLTNGDPYDNLNDGTTFFITTNIEPDAKRFIAKIVSSSSLDLDLFVGLDNGDGIPQLSEEVCRKTGQSILETCDLIDPTAGTWWILVQNVTESKDSPDSVILAFGVVPGSDADNMSVSGPSSLPSSTPFDISVYWSIPEMKSDEIWWGVIALGTDPAHPGNIGSVPIDLVRSGDDVLKTVNNALPGPGDLLTYTITIQPNVTPVDLNYVLTDTIPGGLTYVLDSAKTSSGAVKVIDNILAWKGLVKTATQRHYRITSSANDPKCAFPSANSGVYLDLLQPPWGFTTDPAISGNNVTFTDPYYDGNPYEYFGERTQNVNLSFTDNGYVYLDPANPSYGENTDLPDPRQPNNLLAVFWRDMRIVYDQASNKGVTTGVQLVDSYGTPLAKILEFDGVQVVDDPSKFIDFEVMLSENVSDQPGDYEIIFAYDHVSPPLLSDPLGTIGIENIDGTVAVKYSFNSVDLGSGNYAICFDWQQAPYDPVTITYQVTVDQGTWGQILANNVQTISDNPGDQVNTTSALIKIPQVTFQYHDLESVIQPGEDVWLIGDFTDWMAHPIPLTIDAEHKIFSTTVNLPGGLYQYKYIIPNLADGSAQNMLNTNNRNLDVNDILTLNDYRNVTVDQAYLTDPLSIILFINQDTPELHGEVTIPNVTDPPGAGRGVIGQLGFGIDADHNNWTWFDMTYQGDNGIFDQFSTIIKPTYPGDFFYSVRFNGNSAFGNPNSVWGYGDLNGRMTVNNWKLFLPYLLKFLRSP